MTLLRWLTFLLRSQTLILIVLPFWIYLFLLTLVFVLQWLFLRWEILIMLLSQLFPTNSKRDFPFHGVGYDYSWAIGLCDHLRDVPWENIFKLGASAATNKFCEWVQVGIDVYIPHRHNQVKPHSSLWFSAAFAAAIIHRNHLFCLYQKDKSSDSKVKFRQANNLCKRVLEAAKPTYDNKTKETITSQKLNSRDFWRIANSVLSKGNSPILSLFNDPEVLFLHLIKQKCLLNTFLRSLILMTQVSLYLFTLLEIIWNWIIFL